MYFSVVKSIVITGSAVQCVVLQCSGGQCSAFKCVKLQSKLQIFLVHCTVLQLCTAQKLTSCLSYKDQFIWEGREVISCKFNLACFHYIYVRFNTNIIRYLFTQVTARRTHPPPPPYKSVWTSPNLHKLHYTIYTASSPYHYIPTHHIQPPVVNSFKLNWEKLLASLSF